MNVVRNSAEKGMIESRKTNEMEAETVKQSSHTKFRADIPKALMKNLNLRLNKYMFSIESA